MAGISDKAPKSQYAENKIKFQKQELQNKEFSDGSGLEMYEFKYRFDDCQIGRFWSIDPLASKYEYNSPYAFSENHVTGHVELEGLEKKAINDPNTITYGPLNQSTVMAKDILQSNYHKKDSRPTVISSKLGIQKPKITATLNASAGAALEIKGLGVEGGVSTPVLGIVDNDFYFAGHDYSDGGKLKKSESFAASALGSGAESEKTLQLDKNGNWKEESNSSTVRVGFLLTSKEEKDAKTGETTTTLNINIGAAIGIGLIVKAELTIPIYKEVTK